MVCVTFTLPYKRLKNLKTYIMSTEQKVTNDIKVPNKDLETLRIHFPQCFDKDGNFQLEKFKDNLTTKEINFSSESYGLDWLGKSYARLLPSDPATTLLKADEIHNTKPENAASENLLIKGDNLEVLKHLSHAYREKVKMIYIDPPYNTGGDGFVYQDDRKFTAKELMELAGIELEKARRILDFTRSNSNSHSAWLTFMYPRLYIAKQLLREDGVIFISIDDNEVVQLRMLMDEIFGEENFVAELIVIKSTNGIGDKKGFATNQDYVITFQKSNASIFLGESITEKDLKDYNKEDVNGKYKIDGLFRKKGSESSRIDRPNMFYPLYYSAKTGEVLTELKEGFLEVFPKKEDGSDGRWIWGIDTCKDNIYKLQAGPKGTIYLKNYMSENGRKKTRSLLNKPDYLNDKATNEIKNIFNEKIFDTPKPVNLIKTFLENLCVNNDIVLDFFAGSGTTGDAVMQLNAEDGGSRKYILVQLPEPIDPKKNKAAYDFVKEQLGAEPTIFEITKERLIRAARKINAQLNEKTNNLALKIKNLEGEIQTEENIIEIQHLKEQIIQNETLKAQNAFQIYETTPIWEDYNLDAEELNHQMSLFDESKLTADDIQVLQTTWKTYDGIPLTQALAAIDLGGYHAEYGHGKLYLLNKGFTTDHLKTLLEKIDSDKNFNPTSIITFGYHFDSKNLRELSENVKSYANKKNIDIDFITRY
jgi:adenine-specific DNA-methyltransferase